MKTDKGIVVFALLATAYSGFLAIANLLKLDSVSPAVVTELLTIPMILLVAAVFVFSVIRLPNNRGSLNLGSVWPAAVLLVLNCVIRGL